MLFALLMVLSFSPGVFGQANPSSTRLPTATKVQVNQTAKPLKKSTVASELARKKLAEEAKRAEAERRADVRKQQIRVRQPQARRDNPPVRTAPPAPQKLLIRITGLRANGSNDSDNIEDYKLTVVSALRRNRQSVPFIEKNHRGYKASVQRRLAGSLSSNALIKFDERNQLHAPVWEMVNLQAEGLYSLPLPGTAATHDLQFTTYMCERSGERNCSGMVPTGGQRTNINIDVVMDVLSGKRKLSAFTPKKIPGTNDQAYNFGSGYDYLTPVFAAGTNKVKKFTGKIRTERDAKFSVTLRSKPVTFIYYEIELVK